MNVMQADANRRIVARRLMRSNRAPVLCIRPGLMAIEISKQSGHEAEYRLPADLETNGGPQVYVLM